ncbi:hypothetical protein COW81_02250 [Candidatus Campbellbacteria bacterium CG22_combo_CG10-13_8_21_14_all_36_13]|uniref:Phage holin family protein n=1 Tax=Candidatus Campbellbacteria bacterium CG22_combo_CG10-13_8_21_14_all_36_13 TaxID=1974529 RepID=A0A2H0DY44_9BACT|nr:MAG: hypothetical protein COW81_02250 [Candidatus Campbellbacteria bacterium CG22_combo_CG10-13_8_21_14_all_36_13]
MKILSKLLVTALALLVVTELIPGFFVESFYIAVIVALIFGVINITIKPIITILTLPIHLLTLGLFSFVINALMLWFISSFVTGFAIESFTIALIGALVLAVLSFIGNKLIESKS